MSYSKILSLSCIGGLALSLCANAQQGQRKWRYVAAPSYNAIGGDLVDPNVGNRAALCSWVDEEQHTTTLLVGVKRNNRTTIQKIVYNLTKPGEPNYEKVNIDLEGLTPRNIFRSPENVLYLAANNGKSGAGAKGGVWVSIDGNTWLKLGDYLNDGHITFSVKNEATVVQVKVPGVESTDIFIGDAIGQLEYLRHNKELFAKSKYSDPKQISDQHWFVSITTNNSKSEKTESVGEGLISIDESTSQNLPIVSGNLVTTQVDAEVLNQCVDAINSKSPNIAEICSKVQGNTGCDNHYVSNLAAINKIEQEQDAAEKEKARQERKYDELLERDKTKNGPILASRKEIKALIDQQDKIIKESIGREMRARKTLDESRAVGHNNDNYRATIRITTRNEEYIQLEAEKAKARQEGRYDEVIDRDKTSNDQYATTIKLEIKKQQDIINQKKSLKESYRSKDNEACKIAPQPKYALQFKKQLIGWPNSPYKYDSCVATYDNSGFIASGDQGNNDYVSETHACGEVAEHSRPEVRTPYVQPQEVVAQNNGSMAIVADGNRISVLNNGEEPSRDCRKVDIASFGPCLLKRVMITGVHPTLAWSHSDTATTAASKRYNGVFLALGQSSGVNNRLGVYVTPIGIEATGECSKKSFVLDIFKPDITNLGGTLTGEPAAKVIWWWQKEDGKGSFQNIEATNTESNKEETIEIKTGAGGQKITVYISEFDEDGKKQIPTYITESTGRYRLMASTVIGGFVCDRSSNNNVVPIGSYLEAIGSPTEVIEVTAKCIGSKKVKNKQVKDGEMCRLIYNAGITAYQKEEREEVNRQGEFTDKEERDEDNKRGRGNTYYNNTNFQNNENHQTNNGDGNTSGDVNMKNTQTINTVSATINGAVSAGIKSFFSITNGNINENDDQTEQRINKAINDELDKKLSQITKEIKGMSEFNEKQLQELSDRMEAGIQSTMQSQKRHGHKLWDKALKILGKPGCHLVKWGAGKVFTQDLANKIKCGHAKNKE